MSIYVPTVCLVDLCLDMLNQYSINSPFSSAWTDIIHETLESDECI